MATALVASRPWRAPSSFRRSGVHRTSSTAESRRVACSAEPASTDSTSTSGEGGKEKKHVDTRIHWGNSTDGWIGIEDSAENSSQSSSWRRSARNNAGILDLAPDSHYRYMGVSPYSELEEIKAAYRRLSKLYHPDTTQLPLEIAAQKFMRLKDAYDTLSNQELRSLYDTRLERKVVANTEGSMYGYPISSQQGYDARKPRPERVDVDTLGGRNMPLSGQTMSALAFDLFVLCICIGVIVFVAFFKKAAST